mmetsp:Transcript_22544/g.70574  ORF Transcript_22544/g.70574 Transcript_22544/m.70574 type:complete len:240 (+) Transcript_22544:470-1189(+)
MSPEATSRTVGNARRTCLVQLGFSIHSAPSVVPTMASSSPSPSASAVITECAPSASLVRVSMLHAVPSNVCQSTVPPAKLALKISFCPSSSRSAHTTLYGESVASVPSTTCSVHSAPSPEFSCQAITWSVDDPVTTSRSPSPSMSQRKIVVGPDPMPSLSSEIRISLHRVPMPSTFSCHTKRESPQLAATMSMSPSLSMSPACTSAAFGADVSTSCTIHSVVELSTQASIPGYTTPFSS